MRWILTAVAALAIGQATGHAGAAGAAEVRFPKAALVAGSVHDTPAPVLEFLETLSRLQYDFAFEPGKGTEPRDDLGGKSAKQWLLDHVAGDFECRRDFGGVCESQDARVRFVMAFLSAEGWGVLDGPPEVGTEKGLASVGLDFRDAVAVPGTASGDGEHCVPAIARVKPGVDALVEALMGSMDIAGLVNFRVLRGARDVRVRPLRKSEKVNRVADEAVFVPAPGSVLVSEEDGEGVVWTFIAPAKGPAGFVEADAPDFLSLSEVATPQLCMAERDGQVVITAHVGAGD